MKLFEPIRIIAQSGDPYQNPIVLALSRREDPRFNRDVAEKVQDVLVNSLELSIWVSACSFACGFTGFCLAPIASLILTTIPVMFAIYATNLTGYMISSGDYQLVRLSLLSPVERAWGLFFASLHHVRAFVRLAIIVLPVNTMVALYSIFYKIIDLFMLPIAILTTINAVGMAMVGILVGITARLKYEEFVQAISISTGLTLSVMALLSAGIWWLSSMERYWLAAMLSTGPFLLIIGAFHLAEQWA